MKLHLGCGRNILEGWSNLDRQPLPGVDIIADLDAPIGGRVSIPLDNDSVDEFHCAHVLEHIHNPLAMMEELHRIAKPNAIIKFIVPYGSSDGAWEDPTHVRPMFPESFGYYCQPYYHLADYGYRGDWQIEAIDLTLPDGPLRFENDINVIKQTIKRERNVVDELIAHLIAIKPIREPKLELVTRPQIRYLFKIKE